MTTQQDAISRRRFLRLARAAGITVAGAAVSGPLLAACSDDDDDDTLKIGVVAPFSGPGALLGPVVNNSLDAAVKQLNSNGGVEGRKIEVLVRDAGAEPSGGVRAYDELARSTDLVGILWCGGPGFAQVLPRVKESGLPVVAVFDDPFSAGDLYPEGEASGRSVFQVTPPAAFATAVLADYAGNDRGYTSAALLYDDLLDPDGRVEQDFRRAFEDAGVSVTTVETFETEERDFPQLEALRAGAPQVVFIDGMPDDAARVVRLLDAQGASYADTPTAQGPEWRPHVFGSSAAMGDATWTETAGEAAKVGTASAGRLGGLIYLPSFAVAGWMRTFLGKEPTGGEEGPANGLFTLVSGLERAGTTDRRRVVDAIETMGTVTFASLAFGYSADRHVATTMDDMVVLTLERLRGAAPTSPSYELGTEWQRGEYSATPVAPTQLVRPTLEANRRGHPDVMEEILEKGLGTQCTKRAGGGLSEECKVH